MPNEDPTRDCQAEIRRYIKHVSPGAVLKKVKFFGEGKTPIATLPIPFADETVVTKATIAKRGWDFSDTIPRLDGTIVPVSGRNAEVLKVLAESRGPVPGKVLRDALDPHMSEGTVRWHISSLRDALKTMFPGLEEPIETTPEGYSLQIR